MKRSGFTFLVVLMIALFCASTVAVVGLIFRQSAQTTDLVNREVATGSQRLRSEIKELLIRIATVRAEPAAASSANFDEIELWYDIVWNRLRIMDDSEQYRQILADHELRNRLNVIHISFVDLEPAVFALRKTRSAKIDQVYDQLRDLSSKVNILDGMVEDARAHVMVSYRTNMTELYNYLIIALVGLALSIIAFIVILVRQFLLTQQANDQLIEMATSLRHASQEADQANQAKSEFLAMMSHEFRTPLNAIIGFSDLIQRQDVGPVSEVYQEYSRDIMKSGRYLLGLVNQILDMSRIEAGKFEIVDNHVNVRACLTTCHSLARAALADKRIESVLEAPNPAWTLVADAQAVQRMLVNLISNAMKYTDENGHILSSAQFSKTGELILSIEDTGVGMTSEELDAAIDPFWQSQDARQSEHAGSGLGLAITKSLIEMHGGRLELISGKGIGTTARLIFPPERSFEAMPQNDRDVERQNNGPHAAAS